MAKNVLRNPAQFLGIEGKVGNAFVSQSPTAALSSLPELISFYQTSKGLYLEKFVQVFV